MLIVLPANVAAKVRHRSLNSQKDHAGDCNERKANRALCVNDTTSSKSIAKKKLPDDYVVVETKPMAPGNEAAFEHASKKRRVVFEEEKEQAMVDN